MSAPSGARRLRLVSATTLVVANMIGTGVFTTSGFLLADLRSPWLVLLAWLVGGVLAACGALSYGALARRLPPFPHISRRFNSHFAGSFFLIFGEVGRFRYAQ